MHEKMIIHRNDILKAQKVIDGRVHRTLIVGSSFLSNQLGFKLHFKLELLQKTGSFKPRGVLNKLNSMSEEEKSRGIISLSAGNHAQAVAWAATQSNISSTIVMPAGSLQSKINATKQVQKYVDEVVTVSDENIIDAMKMLLERVKFIAEPAAASTLAVLLSNKIQVKPGSSVICIISGGNIDSKRLKELL